MNRVKIKDIAKVTNGNSDVKDAIESGIYSFFDRSTVIKRSNNYLFDTTGIIIPGEDSRQIFEPRIFTGKFNLHQRCYVIYDFKKIVDPKYLYFKLKTLTKHFANVNVGSTVPSLRLDHITDLEVTLPNLIDQQKIASVLSALDDKIDLNNCINVELEAMAKTLYDYWFVQFDFPDANGKPYKSSGGAMVYDEVLKREIPKGWEVNSLAYFINANKNGDWGKEEKEGNYTLKVECIRGADINGINGKGEVKAPTRYILDKNSHKLLVKNDFVVEISGGSPTQSTGRITCVTNDVLNRFDNPLICSNFCKAVSLKDVKAVFYFLSSWNRAYDSGVLFGFEGKTSGIKNLLFDDFVNTYCIVKPTETLLTEFNNKLSLFEKKRQGNLKENQELASLRDWLLPMLMNGQVTVGGAYEVVDEKLEMVAGRPSKL